MSTTPSPEPYLVYLDCCAFLDIIDPTRRRNHAAQSLVGLARKYRYLQGSNNPIALQVVISIWTIIEAQGILYEDLLKRNGIVPQQGVRNVRNNIPPMAAYLQTASTQINNELLNFQRTIDFHVWLPSVPPPAFWDLVKQLGEEAAIWPNDSLHVASAVLSGCSLFITDDKDLLNKIDYCNNSFIKTYRSKEFSQVITSLPSFTCHGFERTSRVVSGLRQVNRQSVAAALRKVGFH